MQKAKSVTSSRFWLRGTIMDTLKYINCQVKIIPWVKVGGKAWERRSQVRHFCNLAFPGLKERFEAGKIVLFSMGTQLVNVNLVQITA